MKRRSKDIILGIDRIKKVTLEETPKLQTYQMKNNNNYLQKINEKVKDKQN